MNNLSRNDLSNKLMLLGIDINYNSIYKIENGRRIVKDFELSAIAKFLNTTESKLLEINLIVMILLSKGLKIYFLQITKMAFMFMLNLKNLKT